MSLGRLLLAAALVCSLPAFAQEQFLTGKIDKEPSAPNFRSATAATPSEPWRILPKNDQDQGIVVHSDDIGPDGLVVSPGGPLEADATCYTIRSYVVARDSKHSDSTHPVGYSTCQPASRYRLKTAEGKNTILLTR